jgi:flagellar biosynthetic protein FliQ
MSVDFIVGIMAETIRLTLMISAPVLIVQAVTQIQEMTLVFVPKIVACMVVLVAALPWMINLLVSFTHNLFVNIPNYIK